MAYKRHTDFYLPVLKTLEDRKEHEVDTLIAETADLCSLTEADRQERTQKGTQLQYESNIQWAITDLCQGAFIDRTDQGTYIIMFDGLLMLEDNPENPNRDYLESRSKKFKEFRYRKGTRNRTLKGNPANPFTNLSEDDIETDVKPAYPIEKVSDTEIWLNAIALIEKYTNLKKAKEVRKMNTDEEDATIKMLKENLVKKLLMKDIERFSEKLYFKHNTGYALVFDRLNSDMGNVYLVTDHKKLENLTRDSTLIFEQPAILDGPCSILTIPETLKEKNKSDQCKR